MNTKTKIIGLTVLVGAVMYAAKTFAEATGVPVTVVVNSGEAISNVDFVKYLLSSIGNLKGASTLAIVTVVVQGLMMFLKTPLAKFDSKYKLLAVSALTIVSGVLGLKMAGLDMMAAIIHSTTLASFQVFGHQVFSNFIEKKSATTTG